MDENYKKLVFLLLKYAKDRTLKTLFNFICQDTLIPIEISDCSYEIYLMHIENCEDEKSKRFKSFLNIICEIINRSKILTFDKKDIHSIEKIIELSIEFKKILYWNENNVFYYNLENLSKLNNIHNNIKQCKINKKNYKMIIGNTDVKDIRKISTNSGVDRFLSTYKALAIAINNNNNYCPWCNPDESIKPSKRPRRKDECLDISKFIIDYGKYKQKYLNDIIIHTKGSNLQETRTSRGEKLIKILKSIHSNYEGNETNFEEFFTETVEMVKTRYGVEL